MRCTQCGNDNAEGSRFCAHCGSALPAGASSPAVDTTSTISLAALQGALDTGTPAPAPEPVFDPPPAGSALLVVKRGPNAGSRFLLDAEVTTAGRHPDSDIFLDDVTVSRRHAEFVQDDDGYQVRDVGSLNGTYLDRERIESVRLTGGDEVQIGKYRLVFLTARSDGDAGGAGA